VRVEENVTSCPGLKKKKKNRIARGRISIEDPGVKSRERNWFLSDTKRGESSSGRRGSDNWDVEGKNGAKCRRNPH